MCSSRLYERRLNAHQLSPFSVEGSWLKGSLFLDIEQIDGYVFRTGMRLAAQEVECASSSMG
jgi:hypothetical protein